MAAMQLPFAHLNLRVNPFGELETDERVFVAVVDLPPWNSNLPLQFIGECGYGKTTHLLALRARHPESRYYRLDEGEDRLPRGIADHRPLIVDEAQRLCSSHLRRLARRPGLLALATHDDLTEAAGRMFATIRLGWCTLELLRTIVGRRIEWARRGPGALPAVSDGVLRDLLLAHGDNLRAIEWSLYDRFQKMEKMEHVQV
jgi:hypothetical protein